MRAPDAARHRLTPLARVIGVGAGRERARPDNDDAAYEALGLTAAMRQATERLAAEGRTAGWLLTDLTYEMRRQNEWQSVWVRAQQVLGNPYVIEAPAQRIGYLGAAAMPLFVAMAATAWTHGYAPSSAALAWPERRRRPGGAGPREGLIGRRVENSCTPTRLTASVG